MKIKVDLFSDTVTKPSPEMRKFMMEAEVGDEQLNEDPSVNKLTQMTAELLGQEAGIYLPSGHMANQISFAVHCDPGDEILMAASAHPFNFEAGAAAVISSASIRTLEENRGIFTSRKVKESLRSEGYHYPRSRLISVEQTANMGGGAVWPLESIQEVCALARAEGLKTHLDGARLFNAVIASGVSAKEYASEFDSAWIDLSKGLGAPVGSVLTGSKEFIKQARYWKQRLGGAMRQAGIIAAGGIYALENNIDRLTEDHHHAQYLARELNKFTELELNPCEVETNIVIFKTREKSAKELSSELLKKGVRLSVVGDYRLRAVTHLDVDKNDLEYALEVFSEVLN
ncbi:MAG: threonine aldolase family protein [Bacillota bacterium]